MKVVPVNNMILVERHDKGKQGKALGSNPFASVIASANLGIIKYANDTCGFSVGDQVYFGSTFQTLMVEGAEVLAMKEDNVIAYLEETEESEK